MATLIGTPQLSSLDTSPLTIVGMIGRAVFIATGPEALLNGAAVGVGRTGVDTAPLLPFTRVPHTALDVKRPTHVV